MLVPPYIFYLTLPLTTGLSSSLALFRRNDLNNPSPHSFFCSSYRLRSSSLRSLYIGFLIPTLAALLLYGGFLFRESSSENSSSDSSSLAFTTVSVLSVADFSLLVLFDGGLILSGLCLQNFLVPK